MSTTTAAETVKDVIQKSEANTRATFIQNRKDVLIKKWWDEFNDGSGLSFEQIYILWSIDAHFGILSKEYTIPSLEDCEAALNDKGCDWERFNSFFQEHLKIKK